MSRHDGEFDDDDERDSDGYVHELRCDDGKKRHRLLDGWEEVVIPLRENTSWCDNGIRQRYK